MAANGRGRDGALARVASLVEVFGDALRSVVLYGSVVRGEDRHPVSDVNLLVLLDDLTSTRLLQGAPLARRWHDDGAALPLLFTPAEWARAGDSFAIEVADMLDAREVLHGDDPLEGMSVKPADLRLQAERELRGRVVQMREGMLLCADSPPDLGRLLLRSAPSVATYLRTLVRLDAGTAPDDTLEVARRAGVLADVDPEPFTRVWNAREAPQRFRPAIGDPLTEGYFDLVVTVADRVDAWKLQP